MHKGVQRKGAVGGIHHCGGLEFGMVLVVEEAVAFCLVRFQ